jgi:hypothetical protein
MSRPRVSFGIIALNALPFLEYNLRALYPFAHEIFVVEGATRAAASLATADGHSTDGTLEMLNEFKRRRDPDKKLQVVSALEEGYVDGVWPEKDEMSRAYAKRITGDWLWQVDSDEIYRTGDIQAVCDLLEANPSISTISFPYYEFFGGFHSVITGSWHLYEQTLCHRVFRWEPGFTYTSHRPPTVIDAEGNDLRSKGWVSSPKNGEASIFLFHYSYVFPKQAQQKVGYYSNVSWTSAFRQNERWMKESYQLLRRPMFLGEKGWPNLQWLEPFRGKHPEVVEELLSDLTKGKVKETLRGEIDIQRLLASPIYTMQKIAARILLAFYQPVRAAWKTLRAQIIRGP